MQQEVSKYLSIATARISDFERTQHWPFQSDLATALPPENRPFTESSYIKFDRKQNTRLWPFIFTGITRSPRPLVQTVKIQLNSRSTHRAPTH
jgi:hypothetical protein